MLDATPEGVQWPSMSGRRFFLQTRVKSDKVGVILIIVSCDLNAKQFLAQKSIMGGNVGGTQRLDALGKTPQSNSNPIQQAGNVYLDHIFLSPCLAIQCLPRPPLCQGANSNLLPRVLGSSNQLPTLTLTETVCVQSSDHKFKKQIIINVWQSTASQKADKVLKHIASSVENLLAIAKGVVFYSIPWELGKFSDHGDCVTIGKYYLS